MRISLYGILAAVALVVAAFAIVGPTSKPPAYTQKILASFDSLASVVSGTYTRKSKKRKHKAKRSRGSKKKYAKKHKRRKYRPKKKTSPGLQYAKGYRTMCVRLCDGYYFPVSASAHPNRFQHDESVCQARCASPAKLYVYKNVGGSLEEMSDLEGKPYSDIVTAFKHRVAYNPSCTCRSEPWSQEAKTRHRLYALQDAVTELKAIPFTRVAGLEGSPRKGRVQVASLDVSSRADGSTQVGLKSKYDRKKSSSSKKYKARQYRKVNKKRAAKHRAAKRKAFKSKSRTKKRKTAAKRRATKKSVKAAIRKKRQRKMVRTARRARLAQVKRGVFR